MPRELTMRRFFLVYRLPNGYDQGKTTETYERTIDAAYWTTDGDSQLSAADRPARLDFVSFKDTDHKPVFTVRRDAVDVIVEDRDASDPLPTVGRVVGSKPAQRPAGSPSDIIDADQYRTEQGTAWDEGKILRGVLRGRLSIDSARILLGKKPFNLPQTLHAFTYTECPLGCDGETQHCSDCPQ